MGSVELNDVDFGEHGVIYITSDNHNQSTSCEWSKQATTELLRMLPKHLELFNKGKLASKKRVYENCAIQMKKHGFKFTPAQCENKWKSLKRRYLTVYERMLSGKTTKGSLRVRQAFEEQVEAVMKIERPSFKKEIDDLLKVNLNIPPGFDERGKKRKQSKSVSETDEIVEEEDDDFSETQAFEYTQNDEELVDKVLKGSNSAEDEEEEDNKMNVFSKVEYMYPSQEDPTESGQGRYYSIIPQPSLSSSESGIVKEIGELRKIAKKSLEINSGILKAHNSTHEQILKSLNALDRKEDEKLEIKRKKLEKQTELVQQVKIQNSLIAKLIQKLGNSNSTSSK